MTTKIAILLATFHPNGYIKEQIESLKAQQEVELKIYWGDDGSTSEEIEFVKECLGELEYEFFSFPNVGASQNFIQLMHKAPNHNYYAFCDQDDLWAPEKLKLSVKSLQPLSGPGLVHSSLVVVQGDKKWIKELGCTDHSMRRLLSENCFQGCTLVFNSGARSLFLSHRTEKILWHDWWFGWVISCLGTVVEITEPLIFYRLHSKNSIGYPRFRTKIVRFLNRESGLVLRQAELFLIEYEDLLAKTSKNELTRWIKIHRGPIFMRLLYLTFDKKRRTSVTNEFLRRLSSILKVP